MPEGDVLVLAKEVVTALREAWTEFRSENPRDRARSTHQ
jgi:hypothetical protein